jgi:hypothetical protein
MATFLPNITDAFPDISLYNPNLDFYNQMLSRKQSQYEQGLRSIASSYNKMQGELTDPVNVDRRESFMKAADEQLKNVASTDFSLQQNVQAANSIFDPITKDKAIVYDMYHTSRIKKELGTMESWLKSDDPKVRAQYNQNLYDWLKRDLNSLKTGNGLVQNYNVKGRTATAYVNGLDLVNQAAKDMGAEFSKDVYGNQYIVSVKDGKEFRQNYLDFANQVLSANPLYQRQRFLLAESEKESIVERVKADPLKQGLSEDDILREHFSSRYEDDRKYNLEYVDGLKTSLEQQRAELLRETEKNKEELLANPNGSAANRLLQMQQSILNTEDMVKKSQLDYDNSYGTDPALVEQKKKEFIDQTVKSPVDYFAKLIQRNDQVRFANIRSTFGTRKVEKNDAYFSQLEARDRALKQAADIQKDVQQLKINEMNAQANLIRAQKSGDDNSGSSAGELNADGQTTGGGTTKSGAKPKRADVEYLADSATEVNAINALDKIREKVDVASASALQNMTGTFGGLYLLERMGVSSKDTGVLRNVLEKKFSQGSGAKITPEEDKVLLNAYRSMFSFAKTENNEEMLNAMRQQVGAGDKVQNVDFHKLLRLAVANYTPQNANERNAVKSIIDYEKNMNTVGYLSGLVTKGQEAALSVLTPNQPEYQIVRKKKDASGKETLSYIGEDEVLSALDGAKFEIKDNKGGSSMTAPLTKEQKEDIAKAYVNGELKSKVVLGPQVIGMSAAANLNSADQTKTGVLLETPNGSYRLSQYVFNKIPSPEKFYELKKNISSFVPISILPKEARDVVEASPVYALNGLTKDKVIDILASDPTQINSNIKQYVESGDAPDVDPKEQDAVRNALKSLKIANVNLVLSSPTNNGNQAVKITFESDTSDKASPYAGKSFFFPINMTAKTPEVFRIFSTVNDMDEYYPYKQKGDSYQLDYFKSSGINAEFVPNAAGANSGRIKVSFKKYNPATNSYSENMESAAEIPFDLSQMTFSEWKDLIIKNYIDPYMDQKMQSNRLAKQKAESTPEGTNPGVDLYNQLNNTATRK